MLIGLSNTVICLIYTCMYVQDNITLQFEWAVVRPVRGHIHTT